MPIDSVQLSQTLIRFKTDPDQQGELAMALDYLAGLFPQLTVEQFSDEGVRSILVYAAPQRPTVFKIILNGHVDVIPGKDFQYIPRIVGDKLYGVGALDMKSNLAVMVGVFAELVQIVDYPLGLQIVTDEELGGFHGTKYQIDQGVRAEFVIAGETTNFAIAHQAKGILWIKVQFHGQTAHGAYPWRGDNALVQAHTFVTKVLQKYPTPPHQMWVTTVNVARIDTSNQSFNKVPDSAEVWLDIRFIPSEYATVVTQITELLPPLATYTVLAHEAALYTAPDNPYIQQLQQLTTMVTGQACELYGAQGSSDARHYMMVGGAGVEFGPIGGGIASDEEWTSIAGLATYATILREFLLQLK
jgi:succinyl-diaminopimelate desuccinylase